MLVRNFKALNTIFKPKSPAVLKDQHRATLNRQALKLSIPDTLDQGSNVAESRKSLVEDDQRDCINAVQHGRQAVKSSTHKASFQTFNAAEQGLPIESVDLQVRLLVPKNQHEEADKRQAAESSINETTDIDWRYTIKVGFYRYKQLAGAVGYGSNFNKINELNDSRI